MEQRVNILYLVKKSTRYKFNPIIKINNEVVPRCESAMHLGHLLETDNTNRTLVENAISSFNRSFHGFIWLTTLGLSKSTC